MLRGFYLLIKVRPRSIFIPFRPNRLFAEMGTKVLLSFPSDRFRYPFSIRVLRRFFMSCNVRQIRVPREVCLPNFFRRTILRRSIRTTISTIVRFFTITNWSCFSSIRETFLIDANAREDVDFSNRMTCFRYVCCSFKVFRVRCFMVLKIRRP